MTSYNAWAELFNLDQNETAIKAEEIGGKTSFQCGFLLKRQSGIKSRYILFKKRGL